MVGLGTGEVRDGARQVQLQQVAAGDGGATGLDPATGDADLMRAVVEEIAVERHDDARPVEAPARLQAAAECTAAAFAQGRAVDARVAVPSHLRKARLHGGDLGEQGGRGDRTGQQPQAAAALRPQCREVPGHRGAERLPVARPAGEAHRRRTLRIVHAEDRCLPQHVGAAAAPRMLRAALDLERTAVSGGHQDAVGEPVQQRHRGVGEAGTGLRAYRLVDERHFLVALVRRPGVRPPGLAADQSGHRQRGGHQLEEAAAVRPGGEIAHRGELAVQEVAERRRVGERIEAAPDLLAGRRRGQPRAQGRKIGGIGHRATGGISNSRSAGPGPRCDTA